MKESNIFLGSLVFAHYTICVKFRAILKIGNLGTLGILCEFWYILVHFGHFLGPFDFLKVRALVQNFKIVKIITEIFGRILLCVPNGV